MMLQIMILSGQVCLNRVVMSLWGILFRVGEVTTTCDPSEATVALASSQAEILLPDSKQTIQITHWFLKPIAGRLPAVGAVLCRNGTADEGPYKQQWKAQQDAASARRKLFQEVNILKATTSHSASASASIPNNMQHILK